MFQRTELALIEKPLEHAKENYAEEVCKRQNGNPTP